MPNTPNRSPFPSLIKPLTIFLLIHQLNLNAQDTITLKSGETEIGKILSLENNQLLFQKQIGTGSAQLNYNIDLIEKINFSLDEKQTALIKSRDPQNISQVTNLWEQRRPFLSIPESDSWQWGLHLARLKIALNDSSQAEDIERLINLIAQNSWHPQTKEKIPALLLELALLRGETEKALSMAQELSEIAPDNMNLIADAKWILGLSQIKQAQQLETEFPRWQIMPEKVRERRILLDSALENILFPVVFIPSHEEFVPRALDKAIEVYMILDQRTSAIQAAQEIVQYYPHPTYLQSAKAFLEKNPPLPEESPQTTTQTTTQKNASQPPKDSTKLASNPEDSPSKQKTTDKTNQPPKFLSKKDREKLEEQKKSPPKNKK
jgi:hypothetical protein